MLDHAQTVAYPQETSDGGEAVDAKVKTGLIAGGVIVLSLLAGLALALLVLLVFLNPLLNALTTDSDQISPEGLVLFLVLLACAALVFAALLAGSAGVIIWAVLAGRKQRIGDDSLRT